MMQIGRTQNANANRIVKFLVRYFVSRALANDCMVVRCRSDHNHSSVQF